MRYGIYIYKYMLSGGFQHLYISGYCLFAAEEEMWPVVDIICYLASCMLCWCCMHGQDKPQSERKSLHLILAHLNICIHRTDDLFDWVSKMPRRVRESGTVFAWLVKFVCFALFATQRNDYRFRMHINLPVIRRCIHHMRTAHTCSMVVYSLAVPWWLRFVRKMPETCLSCGTQIRCASLKLSNEKNCRYM